MTVRSDWRPTAGWPALRRRAEVLARVRSFFATRGVLEVETPLLAHAAATDLHLESLSCELDGERLWLQTSPEPAMKRLLAAGSGPIYQVSKAFRGGERGRLHNPEFTLLEWYRPGWNHEELMGEVDELIQDVVGTAAAERRTYGELFDAELGLDPHRAAGAELRRAATARGLAVAGLDPDDHDAWLQLLFTHAVEPGLGRDRPAFVVDFPASQAALARVRPGEPPVAERFELYVEGVELANGFHELTDPDEQRRRFEADLRERRCRGLPEVPADERFLAALEEGLPASAGVALGFDRLVMLAAGAGRLDEILAFPVERA